MRIKTITSEWDNRLRKELHPQFGDQQYLELEVPFTKDEDTYVDSRITHHCKKDPQDEFYNFWVRTFKSGLISFIHHNAIDDDMCDTKRIKGPHSEYPGFCGFAGAVVTYNIEDGEHKIRCAWSSNDSHYNDVVPEPMHVIDCHAFYLEKSLPWAFYVKITDLLELMKEQQVPYSLVRGLSHSPLSYEIVHNEDLEDFIANNGVRPDGREITEYWKKKGGFVAKWSGQTPESMKYDREHAVVLRP